ncbi:MAG: hypothetical protein IPK13_14350 [Deltaproteobacteria bacterium]|nr:hypothetical protein [Deltaproteobacteria bacterium]
MRLVWALGVVLGLALVQIPPPLCRRRVVEAYDPAQDRAPSPRALAEVQAAYRALCPARDCGRGLLFQNPTVGNNAVTWVSGLRDKDATTARIVYGPDFLDGLDATFGPGASFGVLAHEVGHHLTAALSARMPTDSSWDEELRADYLAGCALFRSGRPPDELEHALRALAESASASHPSFAHRVPAVRRGYDDCGRAQRESKEDTTPSDGGQPPPTAPGSLPGRLPGGELGLPGLPKAPFGLARWLLPLDAPGQSGCWRYAYRLSDEVDRLGPIAAPRRVSRRFGGRDECDGHRQAMANEGGRVTDACRCE